MIIKLFEEYHSPLYEEIHDFIDKLDDSLYNFDKISHSVVIFISNILAFYQDDIIVDKEINNDIRGGYTEVEELNFIIQYLSDANRIIRDRLYVLKDDDDYYYIFGDTDHHWRCDGMDGIKELLLKHYYKNTTPVSDNKAKAKVSKKHIEDFIKNCNDDDIIKLHNFIKSDLIKESFSDDSKFYQQVGDTFYDNLDRGRIIFEDFTDQETKVLTKLCGQNRSFEIKKSIGGKYDGANLVSFIKGRDKYFIIKTDDKYYYLQIFKPVRDQYIKAQEIYKCDEFESLINCIKYLDIKYPNKDYIIDYINTCDKETLNTIISFIKNLKQ